MYEEVNFLRDRVEILEPQIENQKLIIETQDSMIVNNKRESMLYEKMTSELEKQNKLLYRKTRLFKTFIPVAFIVGVLTPILANKLPI